MVRKYLIGPEPREVAAVPAEGTPYGIAIDPDRERLWVTLTATNQLAGYSIAGDEPVREFTYATIRQPNTVAVDPSNGDVFVGSRSDAQIQRISPRKAGP
jgi:DNA-binding beta-propeller fold protein YncE